MLRLTFALFLACPVATLAADLEVAVQDLGARPLADAVIYADPVGSAVPPAHADARARIDHQVHTGI